MVVVECGGVNTPKSATVKDMEYLRQLARCGKRFWVSWYLVEAMLIMHGDFRGGEGTEGQGRQGGGSARLRYHHAPWDHQALVNC